MRPEYQVSCIYPSLAAEQQISAAAFMQFYFPQLVVHDRTAAGRQLAVSPAAGGADALLLYFLFPFCCSLRLPLGSTRTQQKRILALSAQAAPIIPDTGGMRNGAVLLQPRRRRRRGSRDEEETREEMKRGENVEDTNLEKRSKVPEIFRVTEKNHSYWVRFVDMLPHTLRGSLHHQKHTSKQQYTQVTQTQKRKRQQRQARLQRRTDKRHAQRLNAQELPTQEEQHRRRDVHSSSWQRHAHSHQSQEPKSTEDSWFQQGNPFFYWRRNIVLVPIDVRPRHHAAAGQLPFSLLLPLEELRKQVQAFKEQMCRASASFSVCTGSKEVSCAHTDRVKKDGFVSEAKAEYAKIPPTGTSGARTLGALVCPNAVDRESFVVEVDATNTETFRTAGLVTNGELTVSSSKAATSTEVVRLARTNHDTASGIKAIRGSVSKRETVDAAERAHAPLIKSLQEYRGKSASESNIRDARSMKRWGGVSDVGVISRVDDNMKEEVDPEASKDDAASCSMCESAAVAETSPSLNKEAAGTFLSPQEKVNVDATVGSLATAVAEMPTSEIADEPSQWAPVQPAIPTLTQTFTEYVQGGRKIDMAFSMSSQLDGRAKEKTRQYSLNALDIFVAERLLQLHRNVVRSNHIVCVMVCRRGLDSSIATSMLHELKKLDVVEEQSSSGVGGDEGVVPCLAWNSEEKNNPKEMKYCKHTHEVSSDGLTTTQVEGTSEGQRNSSSETSIFHPTAAGATETTAAHEQASNGKEEAQAKEGSATAPAAEIVDGAEDLLWSRKNGVSVVNLSGGLLTLQQHYLFSMPVV